MRKINKILKHLRSELLSLLEAMSVSEKVIFGALSAVLIITSILLMKSASDEFSTIVPAEGGTINEGIAGYPRYINPLLPITDAGRDLSRLIYSGLMKVGKEGSITADLASKLAVSPDGTTYTAILRDDIYFQDNVPVTAYDVEFTIKRAVDPVIKSPKAADWNGVDIKVIDAKTIEFKLKKPYAPFAENLTLGILPEHIWKDVGSDAFLFSEFNFEPVGSGPYMIKDVKRSSAGLPTYYHLVPWNKSSLEKPYIKDVFIHFYPNEESLVAGYRAGEIESMGSISPANASSTNASIGTILSVPLPRFYAVFFNQNQAKIFADKSVRQALSLATPQDEIIKKVLLGYGTPIESPLPPNISLVSSLVDEKALDKAKAILANDGFTISTSTKILTQKAKKGGSAMALSFSIAVPDVPELKATAEILKAAWEKLGANVSIQVFDNSDLEQNVIVPRKFDALLFGESIGRDTDLFAFWHSSERLSPGLNIAGYTNAKVDKLLESARTTSDESKRDGLYQQFEKEIVNDVPAIFLYAPDFIYVVPKSLKGVSIKSLAEASERFSNIASWYMEEEFIWQMPWMKRKN